MRPKTKFGKVLTQSGNILMSLRYPGQVDDPEFGYYYNWHRWYDFARGRYLSTDPMDEMGDYPYAGGNPVGFTDARGLMTDVEIAERSRGSTNDSSNPLENLADLSWRLSSDGEDGRGGGSVHQGRRALVNVYKNSRYCTWIIVLNIVFIVLTSSFVDAAENVCDQGQLWVKTDDNQGQCVPVNDVNLQNINPIPKTFYTYNEAHCDRRLLKSVEQKYSVQILFTTPANTYVNVPNHSKLVCQFVSCLNSETIINRKAEIEIQRFQGKYYLPLPLVTPKKMCLDRDAGIRPAKATIRSDLDLKHTNGRSKFNADNAEHSLCEPAIKLTSLIFVHAWLEKIY